MNNKFKVIILSFFVFPVLGSVQVNLHGMYPFSIKEDSGEHGVVSFENKSVSRSPIKLSMENEKKIAKISNTNLIFNFTEYLFFRFDFLGFDSRRPTYKISQVNLRVEEVAPANSECPICMHELNKDLRSVFVDKNYFHENCLLNYLIDKYFKKNPSVDGIRPSSFVDVLKQKISECWNK